MAKISYIDDGFKYVQAFIKRDYSGIADEIRSNLDGMSCHFECCGRVYGYKITPNVILAKLYGMDVYVVRFYFADIETLHDASQERCMGKLLGHLLEEINGKSGYYNLRMPANIVDLLRAYNQLGQSFLFCGGTVGQYIDGRAVPESNKNGLHIFTADKEYLAVHYEELLAMTYSSFETYQGQYHCSYVTSGKAGDIYKNWIKGSISPQSGDRVIVAEHGGIPIGFVTTIEDRFTVEGVLSAVLDGYRQYGAYKAMIAYIINNAHGESKSFITSTQFDNFIVQGVWNSLGLRPFYSFYNIHIDKRC